MNKVDSLCVNDSPGFQVHLDPLVQEDPVFLDFPCHPEEKKYIINFSTVGLETCKRRAKSQLTFGPGSPMPLSPVGPGAPLCPLPPCWSRNKQKHNMKTHQWGYPADD